MIGVIALFLGMVWAWVCASTVMGIAFVLYIRTKKPMVVDMFWGAAVTTAIWGVMQLKGTVFPIAIVVSLWGARLSVYLYWTRWRKGIKDPRYVAMETKWGAHGLMGRYYIFYQIQAMMAAVLILPAVIRVGLGPETWGLWDVASVFICGIGLVGEMVADHQLLRHKSAKNSVCQTGLWAYSRHPNYFFEWVFWVGVGISGFGGGLWGILGMVSPLAIYALLNHGTGIPHAEAQSLRRHGQAYRDYQNTTPAFFPHFRQS